MIDAQFGLPGIALRSLEVYLTAVLDASLHPADRPKPEWRSAMDELADRSRASFQRTVYDDESFIQYFNEATPVAELGNLHVGSRPARRSGRSGVTGLRAIPWVFAWTQTRLMLPAWLGVDHALDGAIESGTLPLLREMHREWPFFRSLLDLLAMVLAKASPGVAARYDERLVPPARQALGASLRERQVATVAQILRVMDQTTLLENNPVLARSIAVRNPYVDPINLVQAEVLRRFREEPDDPTLVEAFSVTVNGIAAGMRNTG